MNGVSGNTVFRISTDNVIFWSFSDHVAWIDDYAHFLWRWLVNLSIGRMPSQSSQREGVGVKQGDDLKPIVFILCWTLQCWLICFWKKNDSLSAYFVCHCNEDTRQLVLHMIFMITVVFLIKISIPIALKGVVIEISFQRLITRFHLNSFEFGVKGLKKA